MCALLLMMVAILGFSFWVGSATATGHWWPFTVKDYR